MAGPWLEHARRYVHLSGRDLDDAVRAYSGIPATAQASAPSPTKLKACPRCHKDNSALASFCMNCGMVLTLEEAMNLQERNKLADNFTSDVLAELMKRVPDVLAKIIAEKGGIDKINSIATGELTFNN
jgi:membrane protease subunit (stomatin/prohibitin family)